MNTDANVLFLVLNKTEYLDEILDLFLKVGVKGATILDSQGMGRTIGESDHIFAPIRNLLDGARPYNNTIFTVIENENVLKAVIKGVQNILGDISDPGVGIMFTMPLGNVYGMARDTE